jgi:hypothetical protein
MPLNSYVLPWLLLNLFIGHSVLIPMTSAFIPLNRQQFNILKVLQQKHRQLHSFLKENDSVVEVQQQQQQHTLSDVTSTSPFLLQQQGRREMIGRAMSRSASYTISSLLLMKQQPCWASSDDAIITTSTSSKSSTAMNNNNFILSQPPDSVNLPTGLLESRVLENVYSYPPYGMESIDIFYPTWFYGTWNVASTTTSIEAPLGRSIFGSNATYQSALSEIGTTLQYESRFIDVGASRRTGDDGTTTTTTTTIIADRGYNVQSIAAAALGRNSVVDIPFVSANKLTAILSPIGAPNPIRVDLFTVNRRQEYVDDTHFHCSEVVREIVSSVGNKDGNVNSRSGASSMSTILKEVETTTLYTLNIDIKDPNKVTIRGRQRSAKFLVPTQNDATSFRLYEMTRGKPVDVRFYDVVYTKKTNV